MGEMKSLRSLSCLVIILVQSDIQFSSEAFDDVAVNVTVSGLAMYVKEDDVDNDTNDSDWDHHRHYHSSRYSMPTMRTTGYIESADPWNSPITTSSGFQCPTKIQNLSKDLSITWPNTNSGRTAVSEPLCIDHDLKIVTRQCEENAWDSEPTTPCTPQKPINPCPANLATNKNGRYCYSVLPSTTFLPECPYPRQASWEDYVDLDIISSTPVWIPVQREDSDIYGIDLYRYIEPTKKYKTPYRICTSSCKTFFYNNTFMDKKCLVYHNNTHIEGVSCNDFYPAICVYDALQYQTSSYCGASHSRQLCKPGEYEPTSLCYCEAVDADHAVDKEAPAEFLQPYQNLLFPNTTCRIGLSQNDLSQFVWADNSTINYTYWAPTVNFSYDLGFLTDQGWILGNTSTSNCIIHEHRLHNEELLGNLTLSRDGEVYELNITNYTNFLSVNNRKPQVYCFTDADGRSILHRISDLDRSTTYNDSRIFTIRFLPIDLDQSGPGHYWCQAFLYPHLAVTTSNTAQPSRGNLDYVVHVRLNNYEDEQLNLSEYPLTSENLETLQNLFKNELPANISFYPRIFKISALDEITKEINITFHLTSSKTEDNMDEYNNLRNICKNQRLFEFIEFRHVHYCAEQTEFNYMKQVLTWPLTMLGYHTNPQDGYCVTKNVTLVTRECIGGYVDGAYWSSFTGQCDFYPSSLLTGKIVNITRHGGEWEFQEGLENLTALSQSMEMTSFSTLDFALVTKFMSEISNFKPNMSQVTDLVNNLMMVSREVLRSAQMNFRSTDLLLESVDKILEQSEVGEWKNTRFAVKSTILKDVCSFQLKNCTDFKNCDIQPVTCSTVFNLTDLIAQNVYATVNLSAKLHQQIKDYSFGNQSYIPKLVISVYYGSQLFVEMSSLRSSSLVIGVQLPGFNNQDFMGPITIRYFKNSASYLSYNCSYWNFSDDSTWASEVTEKFTEVITCDFYHITNFGLPVSAEVAKDNEIKVTEEMGILDHVIARKKHPIEKYLETDHCSQTVVRSALDKFCIADNLIMVPINCSRKLSIQAPMSHILENCSTLVENNLQLLDVVNLFNSSLYDSALMMLLNPTSTYQNVTALDLFIVISILKAISNETLDMSILAELVNNVMNVHTEILYNVQSNYKLMDIMLASIENAVANGESGEWKTKNFAIKCLKIDATARGVVLANCSEVGNISLSCGFQIFTSHKQNSTLSNGSVNALVLLSKSLYSQLQNYKTDTNNVIPRLIICIYCSSEIVIDPKSLFSMIFEVQLPNFNEKFQGPLSIFHERDSFSQCNCSFWKFNANNKSSWIVENSDVTDHVAQCDFYHLNRFRFPRDDRQSVWWKNYRGYRKLGYSDAYPKGMFDPNILNKCQNSMEPGKLLKQNSSESFYMIEILENAKQFPFKSLDDFAEFLNSLFATNEDMADSDSTLKNMDRILKGFKDTNLAMTENFTLMTVGSNDSQHFQGLVITENHQVSCLFSPQKPNKGEVSIVFSPELVRQISASKSRIIIAIFYNTRWFPSTKTVINPIVEVLIPDLYQNLQGKILIKYPNALNGKCAYWDFTIDDWRPESASTLDESNIVTCTFNHVTQFALVTCCLNITADLTDIQNSNLTSLEKLTQIYSIAQEHHLILQPIDVSLISQIINGSLSNDTITTLISKIVSTLFQVPKDTLNKSQVQYSATDLLLYSVERMMSQVSNLELHHDNFSVIVKNLDKTNVTGVILHNCGDYNCNFEFIDYFDFHVSNFTRNGSIWAVVILDSDLVKQIKNATTTPKLAISVYYSNVFFNEKKAQRDTTKIFGVTFPGVSKGITSNISGSVRVMNRLSFVNRNSQCAFWNYSQGSRAKLGEWANESRKQPDHSVGVCTYSHVTHFGMLLANDDELDFDPVLNIITKVGCVLSLFGVFVILLTAIVFKKWRQNTGNKILVHFSIAIFIKIVALNVSSYIKTISEDYWCTVAGCVLHYAILSECAWMLTVAILQFKRFVQVLGGPPKNILVKALVCGWVFPTIPVICVIAIEPSNYIESLATLCYPSNLGLYLGVWLPVLVILSINFVIFIFIIYNVFHKKTECLDNTNHDVLFQWRLALLLFFMLGVNMAFGFLGQINGDRLFTYLYSISASLQGFLLFLFFIVFNKSTRLLYAQSIKHRFDARGIFQVWQRSNTRRRL
ncbi:uncharacterized protein [Euwallacea fornicatus]|uniref:uncharacterized protein n=1 Tax=Euwallacea fornicatus TaxID=995702 RepID=UPI00338DCC01